MSRTAFPLHSDDVSAFARSLREQIAGVARTPSHLELLNMLARSAGFRNFQHLRAQTDDHDRLVATHPEPATDYRKLEQLLRFFDAKGRLAQWPSKTSQRIPCLWVLWSRLPVRKAIGESELNRLLRSEHAFDDPALLRRELYDNRLVTRTADCREYRRLEKRPPAEAVALIQALQQRRKA